MGGAEWFSSKVAEGVFKLFSGSIWECIAGNFRWLFRLCVWCICSWQYTLRNLVQSKHCNLLDFAFTKFRKMQLSASNYLFLPPHITRARATFCDHFCSRAGWNDCPWFFNIFYQSEFQDNSTSSYCFHKNKTKKKIFIGYFLFILIVSVGLMGNH